MKRTLSLMLCLVILVSSIIAFPASAAGDTRLNGNPTTCPNCGEYPFYAIATSDNYDTVYQTCANSETRVHFHQYWYHQYDYYCQACDYLSSVKSEYFDEKCQLTNFAKGLENE